MGWIDRAKDIIDKLRASGRSETEVEEIAASAAVKATAVNAVDVMQAKVAEAFHVPESVLNTSQYDHAMQSYMDSMRMAAEAAGRRAKDAVDAMTGAVLTLSKEATEARIKAERKNSNNYRRMHGQPMRRRQAVRRNDRNGNRERTVTHR